MAEKFFMDIHCDTMIITFLKMKRYCIHSFTVLKLFFFIASIWPSFNFFMAQELFWPGVENNEQNKSNVLFWLLNFFF